MDGPDVPSEMAAISASSVGCVELPCCAKGSITCGNIACAIEETLWKALILW